ERHSQRQRILDVLLAARGAEVPSVALSRISLHYSARVKELRELGFRIVNRTERHDGQVHGFFRLELGAPELPTLATPSPSQAPLLPTASIRRWSDPEEGTW
ncbi:MAG TPA: hypothetical protein VK473_19740, partial [Terriglobales bacterium]|nr:hypothetical protein [Terriglobales bacterium]